MAKDGKKFEKHVASIYRSLGYEVAEDTTSPGGKQTDLVAERTVPGAPAVRIYIECKDYKKRIGADEVRLFLADYLASNIKHGFSAGILVSRSGFTRSAKEVVQDGQIKLMSISELADEALNVENAMRSFVKDYEESEICDTYLPLRYESQGERKLSVSKRGSLDVGFNRWLKSTSTVLVLLGDFGTGKTTFFNHLKYQLAKKYLAGAQRKVPLIFSLRNFESSPDLATYVENQIRYELKCELTYGEFLEHLDANKFVLMLDGFDEMGQQTDSSKRTQFFAKLLPLLDRADKTAISCRPSYFVTHNELLEVLSQYNRFHVDSPLKNVPKKPLKAHQDFAAAMQNAGGAVVENVYEEVLVLSISPLTKKDIDRYVRQYVEKPGTEVDFSSLRDRISSTYDLEDLCHRPILLNLIVETVPRLPPHQEASPSIIYSEYTSAWMRVDYNKGTVRQLITPDKKREFMSLLAWEMYKSGRLEIQHNDLPSYISEFFDELNRPGFTGDSIS